MTGAKEKFGKEGLQPKYAAKLIPKPEPSAAKETEQGEGEAKIEQGEGGVAVADVSPKQTGMRRLAFLIKITFILVLKKNKNRIYRKGRAS